jgi:hypothetical protein
MQPVGFIFAADFYSLSSKVRSIRSWHSFLMKRGFICLVYSCCSHLEHRASVKSFISLQILNLRHSVGLLGRAIIPSQSRYLTQTQNKHKQTPMHRVWFEPTIPAFEGEKTVHAWDRAATVIDCFTWRETYIYIYIYIYIQNRYWSSQNPLLIHDGQLHPVSWCLVCYKCKDCWTRVFLVNN